MTAQQAEPVEPGRPVETADGWTMYEVALAAVVLAATVETARVWDRFVPPGVLVEELPDRVRALLVAALARSWTAWRARAASLASTHAAAWLTGHRGALVEPWLPPPPSADLDRLRAAAATLVDRAAEMATEAEDADADPLDAGRHLEADLAAIARRHAEAREAALAEIAAEEAAAQAREGADAARLAADLADLARRRREEAAAEREAIRGLRLADDAAAAEDRRRDAATDAQVRAADDADTARISAEERALDRAEVEAQARARREEQERRDAWSRNRREQARRERREAQRRRAENVARSEAAEAAAAAFAASLEPASEAVGWVRQLDPDPCERCVAWFNSGGDARGPTPVRPYRIRMKRHAGCQCIQRPVTQEEADVRGITDQPEPRHRTQRARDAERARHAIGAAGPGGA